MGYRHKRPIGSHFHKAARVFGLAGLRLVPGGGVEPPTTLRSADFESVFCGFAESCSRSQSVAKAILLEDVAGETVLQSVAAKCTEVGNEQPSKQPLRFSADFLSKIPSVCT